MAGVVGDAVGGVASDRVLRKTGSLKIRAARRNSWSGSSALSFF